MTTGRFAPSPTGRLHVGNLRTALLAWLFARSEGGSFLVRMEDLDRIQSSSEHEVGQLADLAAIGLDWDGPVVRQSDRFDLYEDAIAELTAAGLTYPCYCTRREIREAASAPHDGVTPDGVYPGTCRTLTAAQRVAHEAAGRPPALRLRAEVARLTVEDELLGEITAAVDDVVLRRNDGVPAYNLAVVVDDAAQGIDQVVRGDDLASSTPRQAHLYDLLGLSRPRWAHVPLVLAPTGRRLAKRDGAVTLPELADLGVSPADVLRIMAVSLGLALPDEPVTAKDLVDRFAPALVPWTAWVLNPRGSP
ncbi:MAG: tRNA glutamyl-Q(34) synthetase GluQRS [Microthrixaceae bacterium]|nr:tRNA glutamyl-Q(34) synthetase GluQRS [Microthrixaceae bacterium]